jgi:predicted RND superfamily exporter protein
MPLRKLPVRLERCIFGHRRSVILVFAVLTLVMAYFAAQLKIDAGFEKLLPLEHEYMKTFVRYQDQFGGANRILIALMAKDGNIFTPEFFKTLKAATDEVFFIPGVDRAQVKSLFTPNVRFIEIVEDGFAGGDVIPADFQPTPEGMARVRDNIIKSGQVGRLVASDFSGAMISAQLLEVDPTTGKKLDYLDVARRLEKIRQKYQSENIDVNIHIIGFAKVIGDIADGATGVLLFFAIALVITALLVYAYSLSWKLTALPLVCSLVAVVWQLGLLTLLGFGIDPMSILVPFLVFAIGVSHGVQMVNAVRAEIFFGSSPMDAARNSFHRLLLPGSVALASDTIGFLTIMLINIDIIQEMAVTASLGVAVIILTNLVLLPVLLSYVHLHEGYRDTIVDRVKRFEPFWHSLSVFARRKPAALTIAVAVVLLGAGLWQASKVRIGDLHQGVPELREDSRYNMDTAVITDHFSVGVDMLSVIVETVPDGCIDYNIMSTIDRFVWHMRNVKGVHSAIALPTLAKIINAGWNEGNLKWRALPRNPQVMAQAISPVDTSSGLLNSDCSVMPVMIFTTDHKAETIARIVNAVKAFRKANTDDRLKFRLATGNVGVMAATNEAVQAAQVPMLVYVYAAIILLCLISFRSLRATICIVLPLGLVSVLAYALMAVLEIGLKVSTLPVVALGVGIGVDYGIYIFSRLQERLHTESTLQEAYLVALQVTGNAVLLTGLSLAIGVCTWMFSDLKFQADMGILLTFMFLVNMLGAIILLPALAAWLYRRPKAGAMEG